MPDIKSFQKVVQKSMDGSLIGGGSGLKKSEMQAIYKELEAANLNPSQSREAHAWVKNAYPALHQAIAFYDNAEDAFDHGYLAQTTGKLEYELAEDHPDQAKLKPGELLSLAAKRSNVYAREMGYDRVEVEGEKVKLFSADGSHQELDIKPKAKGGLFSLFGGGSDTFKSVDVLTREICKEINEVRFGSDVAVASQFKLDLDSKGHNPRNAFWAGVGAMLAYKDPEEVNAVIKKWGLEDVELVQDPASDTQVYFAENADMAVISMRGTSSWSDLGVDLKTALTPYKGKRVKGQVHRGFKEAFDAVWPQLKPKFENAAQDGRRIVITGHSLGGALSVLTAAKLVDEDVDPERIKLYTFGQPKVGDSEFSGIVSDYMDKSWYRYVNNNDRAPTLPLSKKYAHGGNQYYLTHKWDVLVDPSIEEIEQDQYKGRMEALKNAEAFTQGGTDGIKDHYMKNYLFGLGKNVDIQNFEAPEKD